MQYPYILTILTQKISAKALFQTVIQHFATDWDRLIAMVAQDKSPEVDWPVIHELILQLEENHLPAYSKLILLALKCVAYDLISPYEPSRRRDLKHLTRLIHHQRSHCDEEIRQLAEEVIVDIEEHKRKCDRPWP